MSSYRDLNCCLNSLQQTLREGRIATDSAEILQALRCIRSLSSFGIQSHYIPLIRDLMLSVIFQCVDQQCLNQAFVVYVDTLAKHEFEDLNAVELISDILLHWDLGAEFLQQSLRALAFIANRHGREIAKSLPVRYFAELYMGRKLDQNCFAAYLSLLVKCLQSLRKDGDSFGLEFILPVILKIASQSDADLALNCLESIKSPQNFILTSHIGWWIAPISKVLDRYLHCKAYLVLQLLERMREFQFSLSDNDLQELLCLYSRICKQRTKEYSSCVRLIGSHLRQFRITGSPLVGEIQEEIWRMYERLASSCLLSDKRESCQLLEYCNLNAGFAKRYYVSPFKQDVTAYFKTQLEGTMKDLFPSAPEILDIVAEYASEGYYTGQQIDFLCDQSHVSAPVSLYWQAAEVLEVNESSLSIRCLGTNYTRTVNLPSQRVATAFTYTAVEADTRLMPVSYGMSSNFHRAAILTEPSLNINSLEELIKSFSKYRNSLPDTINGLRWRNRKNLTDFL
jgi:hypothetical protein